MYNRPIYPRWRVAADRLVRNWPKESQKHLRQIIDYFFSSNFIIEFLAIHPFHDGNGRLSRILTNLLLAQVGEKSPKAKLARWVHFFIDTMVRQIEVLKEFLQSNPADSLLSTNQLRAMELFEKYEEISTKEVSKRLKIPAVTAKQILNRLLHLKLIRRLGAGRSTRYRRVG